MSYFVKAIQLLRPTSQFVIKEEDYSTIEWHELEGNAPTLKEIEAAIPLVKKAESDELAAKEAKRAEILSRLGLTEDEAKLLLS